MQEWIEIGVDERRLTLQFNGEACQEASQLDGCYVLKTDLPAAVMSAEAIYARYKDLAQVEWAFRTFKQGHLEIRPTFVHTEGSTRGHVFVIMLAYLLERELYRCWQDLDVTVAEGIDELGSLRGVEIMEDPLKVVNEIDLTGKDDWQKRLGILFELGQGVKFRKDLKTQKRSFVDHQRNLHLFAPYLQDFLFDQPGHRLIGDSHSTLTLATFLSPAFL